MRGCLYMFQLTFIFITFSFLCFPMFQLTFIIITFSSPYPTQQFFEPSSKKAYYIFTDHTLQFCFKHMENCTWQLKINVEMNNTTYMWRCGRLRKNIVLQTQPIGHSMIFGSQLFPQGKCYYSMMINGITCYF